MHGLPHSDTAAAVCSFLQVGDGAGLQCGDLLHATLLSAGAVRGARGSVAQVEVRFTKRLVCRWLSWKVQLTSRCHVCCSVTPGADAPVFPSRPAAAALSCHPQPVLRWRRVHGDVLGYSGEMICSLMSWIIHAPFVFAAVFSPGWEIWIFY